jgi:hypothetical protein
MQAMALIRLNSIDMPQRKEKFMAIYMVQHVFARPDWEDEWNKWYESNLKVLMSVPGFRTGQRFKGTDGSPPHYMAMYTVDSAEVFESQFYIASGGNGVNSQHFRPAYQVWIRNLLDGIPSAPAVAPDECLVCTDSPNSPAKVTGVELATLHTIGFHKTTPYRGLGVIKSGRMGSIARDANTILYLPITAQMGQQY